MAFITAKSRVRSRAERYTIEPMIPTATIHSSALMNVIVWSPLAVGRLRSACASATVRDLSPAGTAPSRPSTATALTNGWPANAITCASSMSVITVGVPK